MAAQPGRILHIQSFPRRTLKNTDGICKNLIGIFISYCYNHISLILFERTSENSIDRLYSPGFQLFPDICAGIVDLTEYMWYSI